MDKLQMMKFFVSVARTGGFAPVAANARTSSASVSRSISRLEELLATRLLNRTTRKVSLTCAGQKYLRHCEQILDEIRHAEREAAQSVHLPAGTIKVHIDTYLGSDTVLDAITDYQASYPQVTFDITMSAKRPDLVGEGFDVALLATTSLCDSNFVSQRLGSTCGILCASPGYLSKHGMPGSPEEIANHQCISLSSHGGSSTEWQLLGPGDEAVRVGVPLPFIVNTADTLRYAIDNGMGIGLQAASAAQASLAAQRVVRVLPQYRTPALTYYAIYPSRRYVDAKVKTWIAFLKQYFPDTGHALATGIPLQVPGAVQRPILGLASSPTGKP